MKISPRELREAQIPSKAFGFNQDVVDALLERAADTIEGLIEENRQLFEALERMRSEGTPAGGVDPFIGVQESAPIEQPIPIEEPVTVAPAAKIDESLLAAQLGEKEGLINKTLLLAQKTSDETLKNANEQAAQLIAASEKKAAELVAQAKEQAETLTGVAKQNAESEVKKAQAQAVQMVDEAKAQAQILISTAQDQADSIHKQERDQFVELVTKLTHERAQLLSDIEILQGFDKEHRAKLLEAAQGDLAKLESRETIDVGAIPALPIVQDIPLPIQTVDEPEPEPEPVVAPAVQEDVFEVENDEEIIEAEVLEDAPDVISPASSEMKDEIDDPFAAFVDSPSVVAPAGDETPDEKPQVAKVDSEKLESSSSPAGFNPSGAKKSSHKSELDDDDFFASLREAVADDSPLGSIDSDEEEDGGAFKGLFKK